MRDFRWIRSFALTEALGPSEKDLNCASKGERSKQSRSFARSKTRKPSCRINGSFPRPTKIQQSRPTLIQKKGEGFGNKISKRLSIIVARVPNLNYLIKYQRLLSVGFIRKGAVHYKLSALS